MQEGKDQPQTTVGGGEDYPYPAIELSNVQEAARRIQGKAHKTPVMTCTTLDELAGRQLFFKCENFQKVHSPLSNYFCSWLNSFIDIQN